VSGLKRAFDHFGAKPKNIRWSVSGRTPDGRTVVMVLWKHRLDYHSQPISYSHFGWRQLLDHNDEPSAHERVENLKWARDHCDGLFRVIIAVPIDTNDLTRGIAEAFPQPRLIMRLVEIKEQTGEFRAIIAENLDPGIKYRGVSPLRIKKAPRKGRISTPQAQLQTQALREIDKDWWTKVNAGNKKGKRKARRVKTEAEINRDLRRLPQGVQQSRIGGVSSGKSGGAIYGSSRNITNKAQKFGATTKPPRILPRAKSATKALDMMAPKKEVE
jgi:hypothetical protein